jgi:hypothetical protein
MVQGAIQYEYKRFRKAKYTGLFGYDDDVGSDYEILARAILR